MWVRNLAGVMIAASFTASTSSAQSSPSSEMLQKTYRVSDLEILKNESAVVQGNAERKNQGDALVKLIRSQVAPTSWLESGGQGELHYFVNDPTLVVRQTSAIHGELKSFLDRLRKNQDVVLRIEVKTIVAADETVREACRKSNLDKVKPTASGEEKKSPLLGTVNDEALPTFLNVLTTDRRTNIVQSPAITTVHGRRATVQVGNKRSYVTKIRTPDVGIVEPVQEEWDDGQRLSLTALAMDDKNAVALVLRNEVSEIDESAPVIPVHYQTSQENGKPGPVGVIYVQSPRVTHHVIEGAFTVAKGQTIVLAIPRLLHGNGNQGNLIGRIPYVNRLVRSSSGNGAEIGQLLLLVRAEVTDENERRGPPMSRRMPPLKESADRINPSQDLPK